MARPAGWRRVWLSFFPRTPALAANARLAWVTSLFHSSVDTRPQRSSTVQYNTPVSF